MISKAGFVTFLYGTRVGNAPPPPLLKFRSSNFFIIGTIVIAVFTDVFLYSFIVPVLPFAFTQRAGVREEELQKWTSVFLSVYGGALAVGSPIAGYFADKSASRRTPLLIGLLALGGSTVLLCLGESLAELLAGRILQGISAGVVWTVGLALLSDTVDKDGIGQAMGYIAAAFSVGALAGPLLGGVVYERAGYYAVFAMGFTLIGLDIVLRLMLIEKSVAAQWTAPPSTTPIAEEQFTNTSEAIQPAPTVEPSDLSGGSEKPAAASNLTCRLPPMIKLLSIPRLLISLFGCFVQASSLASFDSALPLFVKNTFNWNSTGAGLIFICLVVPSLLGPLFGAISDKYGSHGSRALCTVGFIGSVPFWVSLRFVTHNTIQQKVLLCALLACINLFLTMGMAPLMAEIIHVVDLEERRNPGSLGKKGAAAQGFGLFNFAFAIGTLIGPIWAGFVVEKAGWGTMGWTLGLLSGVAALATFWWTGGRIMLKGERGTQNAVV